MRVSQSFAIIITFLFTLLLPSHAIAKSVHIYSKIGSATVADRAMDLYRCLLLETNFDTKVVSDSKKEYPFIEIIESTSKIDIMVAHSNARKENFQVKLKEDFSQRTCTIAKQLFSGKKLAQSNKEDLGKISRNFSLSDGNLSFPEEEPRHNFVRKNWPWLLGGIVAVGAAILLASNKSSSEPSSSGTSRTVIRGVSVR